MDEDEIALEMDRFGIQLKELLYSIRTSLDRSPEEVTDDFFARLPEAFEQLTGDAAYITENDPAASCVEEIVLCYPGFFSVTIYRLAHILYERRPDRKRSKDIPGSDPGGAYRG